MQAIRREFSMDVTPFTPLGAGMDASLGTPRLGAGTIRYFALVTRSSVLGHFPLGSDGRTRERRPPKTPTFKALRMRSPKTGPLPKIDPATSSMLTNCARILTLAALFGYGAVASAQCSNATGLNPPVQTGSFVGVVVDSSSRPIDGVEVVVSDPLRRARSGADGRFILENLPRGVYTVMIRKIGYQMVVRRYQVPEAGASATICMSDDGRRLLPVITAAKRLGLSGVVGDSALTPLSGAEVHVLAGGSPVLTDSAGGFFLPLRAGSYAVVVSKPGYGRELLSVTIPKDSGRAVAVWLGAIPPNPNRLFAAYDDMRTRMQVAVANRSALITSEDLTKKYDLFFAAQDAIRQRLSVGCSGLIDGGPYTLPIATIPKEEVAMMEIYLPPPVRRSTRSISASGTKNGRTLSTAAERKDTGCGQVEVYIWLKK